MKTAIPYATFDLLHVGHILMLERFATLGDRLIVGVSTDEFNQTKSKPSLYSYQERSKYINNRFQKIIIDDRFRVNSND